jgi:hypothetical protein
MAPHVEAIKAQVAAHMQAWRTANPEAPEEARRAERRSFARPLLLPFFGQCRASVRAALPAR